MEDCANQLNNEEASMSIKSEPEVVYEVNEAVNWPAENSVLENTEDTQDLNQEDNKSRRRSRRTRVRNHRYKSDDDINITLSPDHLEYIDKNSDEDFVLQEPSSSTSAPKSTQARNMKRKRIEVIDSLGQVMIDIGLYEELYDFMKSRGITADALKFMQTRHIDELFRGTRLSTKIIFEHNLREWQNKLGICEVTTTESTYTNKLNAHTVQLMKNDDVDSTKHILNMPHFDSSVVNQRLTDTDISILSNRLRNAIQHAINTVLQEFRISCQQLPTYKPNNYDLQFTDEIPIDEIVLQNIKTEPNTYPVELITPDKAYKKVGRKPTKLNKVSVESKFLNRTTTPQPKKRKTDSDMSVHEILGTIAFGQRFIEAYQNTGILTPNQRSELVRFVVDFYMRNSEVITMARCRQIAEEIVEIFPTECVETYFIQDNKNRPPKGKIWDRYQGRKRSMRKIIAINSRQNAIKREQLSDLDETSSRVDWSEMEAMCAEMKNINDEKELLEKWKASFSFRRHQLQSGWFNNWKMYFDEYPFCKQQNYAQYIESDLSTLYPNLKFNDFLWDEFMENFPTFFENRIKHQKSKLIFDQLVSTENLDTTSDYVAIKVIEILHAVLKVHSKHLQSIEESQRKFTVEVNDLSDLKKAVIERKKQYADNNIQTKPYIAVVGQNKIYSHFSVILDSTGFSCDNFKESLILCFNLYLFFDISFPHESLNVWTFIQKYFFNKPTLVSNPRVETFINDLKAQKIILDVQNDVNGIE